MTLTFETHIKEPRRPSFHLEIRTVKRRGVPVAAFRDGAEVHGLRKLKYVLWYGLFGALLLSIVLLLVAAAVVVDRLLTTIAWRVGAAAERIASRRSRAG